MPSLNHVAGLTGQQRTGLNDGPVASELERGLGAGRGGHFAWAAVVGAGGTGSPGQATAWPPRESTAASKHAERIMMQEEDPARERRVRELAARVADGSYDITSEEIIDMARRRAIADNSR